MKCFLALLSFALLFGCEARHDSNLPGQTKSPSTSVIEILSDLKNQVNAETSDNVIPWYTPRAPTDVQVKATFQAESPLVKTLKGDYSYTIYRFTYSVTEVQNGEFSAKELTFFIERKFPASSQLRFKELWPFRKDKPLLFKLQKGIPRYLITSIELYEN